MVVQNLHKSEEKLKEKILEKEEKKSYSSERFTKIEEKVKDSLSRQATDEALKDITLGALVL
jgi:chaperonin cofactor prefoldin